MKVSNRSKTTRPKTSSAGGRLKKRKPKKDNSKLFIGLGIGAFVLIFVVIAIASGGSSNAPEKIVKTKKSYSLPKAARMEIYSEYIKIDDKLEDEFQNTISSLPLEQARKQGVSLKHKKNQKLRNATIDLRKKCTVKYPGLTKSYFNKIIDEGIDKGW